MPFTLSFRPECLERITFVLFFGVAALVAGCSSTDPRIEVLAQRIRELEAERTGGNAREFLARIPAGEKRLETVDARLAALEATSERIDASSARLEAAAEEAQGLIARLERLEEIRDLGRYGRFVMENRERLSTVLAGIEAEYRQVSRQAPGLIRARELHIVNGSGQTIARLGEGRSGSSQLELLSSRGKELLFAGVSETGAGGRLRVSEVGGTAAIDLWVSPSGAGNLRTSHRYGTPLVELVHDEVDGRLHVHSAAGPVVGLGVVDGVRGTIETWDDNELTLVRLGSMASGGGSITVYDGDESPVVLLRAIEAELGKVDVRGPNGRARELRP